ncbi:MAG: hypothetical protein SPI76_04800, partial [Candidatus Fimenecus sp.]|nr:hypothetical protein [Candidatus Fimenecus sp.]
LSLTHYATPPFPQKSRSACLFGCKRPHDGSLSLPTFADLYIAFSLELHIILTINGGSKPPPYNVVVCTVSFAAAHCRYQLLRIADSRIIAKNENRCTENE